VKMVIETDENFALNFEFEQMEICQRHEENEICVRKSA